MKNKGFAPLIIILVIAILGVVVYFAYKSFYQNQSNLNLNNKYPEIVSFVRTKLKLSNGAMIEIKRVDGDYSYGKAGESNDSGYYWGVAKVNGQLDYVFVGNGIPNCKDVEIFPIGVLKTASGGGQFDICYKDNTILFDRKTNHD